MRYCVKCGERIENDDLRFCPFCGEEMPFVSQESKTENNQNYTYGQNGSYQDNGYQQQMDWGISRNHKGMAILSYLGILVLIPLLAGDKQSEFIKFHVNQGLVLFIISMVVEILDGNWIYRLNFMLNIGTVIGILFDLVDLAVVVLAVMGIISACKGEKKKLPVIGDIQLIK